ncbi:MAG: hypothetical protein HY465_05115 [Deltaproteobacteria bacterium]|nr:hypothetical protein [Deltaproteobacteria bacterium]
MEEKLFDGDIESVVLPGTVGQMTILPHHAGLLATLQAGTVKVRAAGGEKSFSIAQGIAEVARDTVTVLATPTR